MMVAISIYCYYHDILIFSWYIKVSNLTTLNHTKPNTSSHDIDIDIMILSWYSDIIMIFWYYHDISKYQTSLHLVTPRPTLHHMISISIYCHYHDILILSWYITISNLSTLKHTKTINTFHDIDIDILLLSWYSDIIMINHNIKPLYT